MLAASGEHSSVLVLLANARRRGQVREKMVMLHKELSKVTTLAACAKMLQQSSEVLGTTLQNHLQVDDVDRTMERLERQLHTVNHTERAMAEPLKRERVRDVLDLKLPDLPQRRPEVFDGAASGGVETSRGVFVDEKKEKESVFVLE